MIELRTQGKEFTAVAQPANVTVFKACFYETAVEQAFARDGDVRCDGVKLEKPKKERRERRPKLRSWRDE